MSNHPLVSVVMNCYNSDRYLKESIQSVLSQTYQNWEIIFWDNQSTDNSAKIVNSYDDKRIKYFYAPKFTPLGEARNLAIDKCSGDWVGFLDCDDLWHKDKLQISFSQLEQYKNNKNVSLLYSKTNIINSDNKIISNNNNVISGNIYNGLLKNDNFIIFSSIIVRKEILLDNEKINQSLNYCEDYDLLLKVTKNNEAIGVDEFLTFYRVHDGSITSTKMYDNYVEEIDFLIEYISKNRLDLLIKLSVKKNISYKLTAFILKLIIKMDSISLLRIIKKYYSYLLFSPFILLLIIYNKLK